MKPCTELSKIPILIIIFGIYPKNYHPIMLREINYKDLMQAIEKRPAFFLRNQNLDELDAFLRGISYMNFVQGNPDQFRDFYEIWFPRTFPQCTHDWLSTLREMPDAKGEWQLFFEVWNRYILEHEKNSMDQKA